MRQETTYIAAIDIGTTKIVSLVGKLNENKNSKYWESAKLLLQV